MTSGKEAVSLQRPVWEGMEGGGGEGEDNLLDNRNCGTTTRES